MCLITGLAVYFVVWWITLFIVLPFGIARNQDVTQGNDPGAPVRHRMLLKILVNTVLAFFVWLIIYLIDIYDLIDFRNTGGI